MRQKYTLDIFDASEARLMGDPGNDTRLMSSEQSGGNLQVMLRTSSGPGASIKKAWLVRDGKTITSLQFTNWTTSI